MDKELRERIAKRVDTVFREEMGTNTPWATCLSYDDGTCLLSNMGSITDVAAMVCMTLAYAIGGQANHDVLAREQTTQ